MDKLTTATGREFQTDYLVTIARPAMMFVRILGSDAATVTEVFHNPEETARLTYAGVEYDGFTKFVSVTDEGDALKVGLEKIG